METIRPSPGHEEGALFKPLSPQARPRRWEQNHVHYPVQALASWAISLLPHGSSKKLQLQIDKGKEETTYTRANCTLPLTSSLAITLTVGTGGSVVKNLPANAGDAGLIPGLGRPPGGGHGNPVQYSCLENPMDRGAGQATVHGVTKSQA